MRLRLRKLVERVRRARSVRWPWKVPSAQERVAFLPPRRVDFTVHRDVALRLRDMSIDLRTPLADPGPESGAFKIRVASSPQARREASSLVRKRYEGRGYLTSTTLVSAHSCTFTAYDEGHLSGTVTLRLEPAPTALRVGGVAVLADTDKIEDRFHNVVRIVSSARLRTG